jgi:uroporphyrinogen III methyltransferase/synthase
LIDSCDIVIYDALVNEILVTMLPESVRRVFVGKRGGESSISQIEINKMLVREARKGKKVARLKGGDPLLLGRGSEEMEYLRSRKIPFEIVPGVSSALAAPAWAGIPVTHRSLARSVAIITGHLKSGDSMDMLALPSADTLVFLMAMQNLDCIITKLLATGRYSNTTPAAIIRNGTLADQQVVSGTLGTICALKTRRGITAPAVFLVGNTAAFAKTLQWYKRPPLAGKRVVVLRTPAQSGELLETLISKGATVVSWPILQIRPRSLEKISARYLASFTMVIFTSPNGVRLFMDSLRKRGIDSRCFHGKKIFALGAGTARVLAEYGIIADGIPAKYVAEGLLELLPKDLRGNNILIPRAAAAREVLPDSLAQRGAKVTVLPVYDTLKRTNMPCPVQDGDYVLFTSSSTAEFYFQNQKGPHTHIIACCMGDITAATVRHYFSGKILIAENATIAALVKLLEHKSDKPKG